MPELDSLVRRLSQITDRILALDAGERGVRFELERERDRLRAEARCFAERKDGRRTIYELDSELIARRTQLEQMNNSTINVANQTQNAHGYTMAKERGDTVNSAILRSLGANEVRERINEIKRELLLRGLDSPKQQ